jgi:Spy/CpxP family protein refolding chaperone
MKTSIIKTAGILFLSILMTTSLLAQRPNQGGRSLGPYGSGDGPGRTHRYAALDLSEEQQVEITTIRTTHYKEITPLKNKMAELKARERTLLSEETVDMKAVGKVIDEQTALTNSMRKLQVEHQLAVKGLLSDEQVLKLQQRRQYAQRDGRRGNGGRKGAGIHDRQGSRRDAGYGRGYRGM